MKEMPKEIWLHHVTNPSIIGSTWLERKVWDNDVEYVHKDAFIEKVCDWFRRIDYDDNMPPFETTEEFIEGFKKAMKL